MAEVESRFNGGENAATSPDSGQLLALVDALHAGTLNDAQRKTVQALRAGILAMAGNGNGSKAQAEAPVILEKPKGRRESSQAPILLSCLRSGLMP